MMLSSHEVRWFFRGTVDQHKGLRKWAEFNNPIERDSGIAAPEWKGRLNGKPDVYLIVPEHVDMGIKSREGQLQIKGLQCALGTQVFTGGRQGCVERWIKWSYEGEAIDQAFAGWFSEGGVTGPRRIEVFKTRCLRKARLDPQSGKAKEVNPDEHIERGCALEVSDLRVGTDSFSSLAFEAFPDDSAMHSDFNHFVNVFLNDLPDIPMSATNSMGYPAWLMRLATT
ncbi:MAG: hypothetical protein ACLP59_16145 [Bryobacteraceae bacterium]